jgi:indolepyruvate decarboxylase
MLVNPCYYKDPLRHNPDFYNELHDWNYGRLVEVFQSKKTPITDVLIHTNQDLKELLGRLADENDVLNNSPVLVHVRLSCHDYPRPSNTSSKTAHEGHCHP